MAQFAADPVDVRDPHPELARRRRDTPGAVRPAWGPEGAAVRRDGGLVHGGPAGLVRELTSRSPVQVIGETLGLPREDHEQFHEWAGAIISVAARPMEGIRASQALRTYLEGVLENRRATPRDDLV